MKRVFPWQQSHVWPLTVMYCGKRKRFLHVFLHMFCAIICTSYGRIHRKLLLLPEYVSE